MSGIRQRRQVRAGERPGLIVGAAQRGVGQVHVGPIDLYLKLTHIEAGQGVIEQEGQGIDGRRPWAADGAEAEDGDWITVATCTGLPLLTPFTVTLAWRAVPPGKLLRPLRLIRQTGQTGAGHFAGYYIVIKGDAVVSRIQVKTIAGDG